MDTYTDKVKARADLAEALQTTHRDIAARVGLVDEDLAVLVTEGRNAARADAEQKMEEAEQSADISLRALSTAELLRREMELRARVPAVVRDVEAAGHARLGLILRRVSFERFRVQELKAPDDAPPPTEEEQAEIRRVTRVSREDTVTRLNGLAEWIDAMRAPGREPILESLARRGLPAAELAALGDAARARAAQGGNKRQPLDATAREAAAVEAQRTQWSTLRRMLRLAAAQNAHLAGLFAAC